MGARQSTEMTRALKLIDSGSTVLHAAAATKLWPNSIYSALKKRTERLSSAKNKQPINQ